jgi:hypothetical protein
MTTGSETDTGPLLGQGVAGETPGLRGLVAERRAALRKRATGWANCTWTTTGTEPVKRLAQDTLDLLAALEAAERERDEARKKGTR